ncbi:MAG: MBL fold metallo-hydrolase [Bacteroidetes bacterium]|jgi:glyoxylase-like metal-dependent hydrolase (beta-lactamase superfamily II)|nr:MBL fold metallo-hydrolase [Bacteroidota bacterium]
MLTQEQITRRSFIGSAGLLTAGILLAPKNLFAQTESPVITIKRAAATAKINITKLRGNVNVLEGSGGNIAVLDDAKGKLLVDAGIGVSKPNVSAALNSISSAPLKYLINTHWHFDHTDGNEWLHNSGATIIAQENTHNHLSNTVRVDDWDYTFPPLPKGGLPTILVKNEHMLHYNEEMINIKYYTPAHTNGDLSVYFSNADILHTGDTWWNGYYPFIDYNTGGSIDGAIKAADLNVKNTTDKTIIIPGHGPVGNRSQLTEFRDMLVTCREKIASLKKQGYSLEEVVAAKPTANYDEKYGGFVINSKFFASLIYRAV